MNYDIIIIGSGMGGLTASLKLAKSGKKVALFEKHYVPGGYATNFKRKGKDGNIYNFDSSLHALAGSGKNGAIYQIMDELGILKRVNFLKKQDYTTLVLKNKIFDINFNFNDFKNLLIDNFPNLELSINEIFNTIENLYDGLKLMNSSNEIGDFIRNLQSITIEDFLKKYTDDCEFIQIFTYLWGYLGLPPSELNAFIYLSAMGSYLIADTHYIKNGSGYLSQIMAEEIEKNEGKVYLSSEIINIETKNKTVVSVTTKKGETFTAKEFIFACDPNHIFSLINSNIETDDYIKNMNSLEKSMSITQLYLAIDCPTTEVGINSSHIFVNKTDYDIYYNNIKNGNYNNLNFCMACYDKLDPDLNKHGAFLNLATVDFATNWPERGTEEYKTKKAEITQLLLNELYAMFPKIKEHIQVIELGTPRTMERYTNNSNGSIYGWAQNIHQSGFNRLSFKTPFNNAIIVGAWSFPCGGYSGAIFSGYLGAQRLLSKKDNTSSSVNELIPLDMLINGLIKRFNPENAEGVDITYKFIFDEHDPIYLEVKNQSTRLLPKSETPEKVDTILTTTHETWQKISLGQLSGQDALMDGLITCEGNLKNFASIPKIFDKQI